MVDMTRDEALLYRADLLQQVKGLELQRAAILSTIARLEKNHHIERGKDHDASKRTNPAPSSYQDAGGKNIDGTNQGHLLP